MLKKKIVLTLAHLFFMAACGSGDDANVLARVGWQFNYADWMRSAPQAQQLRTCNNQDARSPVVYRPITHLRLTLTDPAGLVPGIAQSFPCERGESGQRITISGIVRQVYTLHVEALAHDQTVLYRYTETDFDLSAAPLDRLLTLNAATAELRFQMRANGSIVCPDDVAQFTYELRTQQGGDVDDRPSIRGKFAACTDGYLASVLLTEIPIFEEKGAHNNYVGTDYELSFVGEDDAAQARYCGKTTRSLYPAGNNSSQDIAVDPQGCVTTQSK